MVDDFREPEQDDIEIEEEFSQELSNLATTDLESRTDDIEQPEKITSSSKTPSHASVTSSPSNNTNQTEEGKAQQLEQVMSQGMGFLSGLFKMATGKDMGAENAEIKVDQASGEVTMKFKIPNL